jgi:hypothetical protein
MLGFRFLLLSAGRGEALAYEAPAIFKERAA